MRQRSFIIIGLVSLLAGLFLLHGCGSSQKEPGPEDPVTTASRVGSDSCVNTCHAASRDFTMYNDSADTRTIVSATNNSLHMTNPFEKVLCEDCHGGGSLHWGNGPIPYPVPQFGQCQACHKPPFFDDPAVFQETAHANGDNTPDKYFFQGGTGADQALDHGNPLFVAGTTTPVSKNQHIEECSVCHNSNHQFRLDENGNMQRPDPNRLTNPTVSCGNCHDAHQVALAVAVPTRTSPVNYPLFHKVQTIASGATDVTGTWFRPAIYQPNGRASGGTVSGTNNELSVERLCAACHTKGLYKHNRNATHQTDVYTQWKSSGHGDRSAPAFGEFSANPPAYDPTFTAGTGSHQSIWPYDMSLGSSAGGSGRPGAGSTATTNMAVPDGRGGFNDNYQCYKCHNGITSLAYQDDVQGTADAPVVFGDEPVTCITCHDPHANVTGLDMNVRQPQVLSKYINTSAPYSTANPFQFAGDVFFDNTPAPSTMGKGKICVFCHQGRESGYTLFKRKLVQGATITGSFLNPHYLGTGAMLWARNGYEFPGNLYGEVQPHQQTNCYGCHMAAYATNEVGGHTWRPVSEDNTVVNNAACNTAACHNGTVPGLNTSSELYNYRMASDTNDYDGNGALEGIAQEIKGLENQLIALLRANGVYYNDLAYPYFFADAGLTTQFTAWTPPTYKAAFNVSFVIKGIPSSATSAINRPNMPAAVHNYRYNIQLLRDSYDALCAANTTNCATAGGNRSSQPRPAGTRTATNYNPQADGSYDPRQ